MLLPSPASLPTELAVKSPNPQPLIPVGPEVGAENDLEKEGLYCLKDDVVARNCRNSLKVILPSFSVAMTCMEKIK